MVTPTSHTSPTPYYQSAICDANIASIIYSSPLNEEWKIPHSKKKMKCYFWKKRKPECGVMKKRKAFLLGEAKEHTRLKKLTAWKRIQEGQNGKSTLEMVDQWQNHLRKYDSSWQQHIGHDTRKRHQDQLIKAVVRHKPISDLQELRRDAIMMEDEVFGTSKHLDEYRTKIRQIIKVYRSRVESEKREEALHTHEYPTAFRRRSFELRSPRQVRWKLDKFISKKRRKSLARWFGGKDSPKQHKCLPSTPCKCREKEMRSARLEDDETALDDDCDWTRSRKEKEKQKEKENDPFEGMRKPFPYKPNLKKIQPSYKDKTSALGWSHIRPEEEAARSRRAHDARDNGTTGMMSLRDGTGYDDDTSDDTFDDYVALESVHHQVPGMQAKVVHDDEIGGTNYGDHYDRGQQSYSWNSSLGCNCFGLLLQPDEEDL